MRCPFRKETNERYCPGPAGMRRHRGQLDGLSADGLKIRAAYPTAGNYKALEIASDDIQSVYLAK